MYPNELSFQFFCVTKCRFVKDGLLIQSKLVLPTIQMLLKGTMSQDVIVHPSSGQVKSAIDYSASTAVSFVSRAESVVLEVLDLIFVKWLLFLSITVRDDICDTLGSFRSLEGISLPDQIIYAFQIRIPSSLYILYIRYLDNTIQFQGWHIWDDGGSSESNADSENASRW